MATPEWLKKSREHTGKGENDKGFVAMLSSMWGLVGLKWIKTIIGSAAAWCGLWVAFTLYSSGLPWQKTGGSAIAWDTYGQKIEYKVNGIPEGAIVRINHYGNCKRSDGNHVTFANGDCAPQDIVPGKIFDGHGGNQGNMVKISPYPMEHICSVRWPPGVTLPGKVTVSKNCSTSGKPSNESTR